METRYHGSYGHGLRPGTTADINCPKCQREDAVAEIADDLRVMMRGGLTLQQAHHRLMALIERYRDARHAGALAEAVLTVGKEGTRAVASVPADRDRIDAALAGAAPTPFAHYAIGGNACSCGEVFAHDSILGRHLARKRAQS